MSEEKQPNAAEEKPEPIVNEPEDVFDVDKSLKEIEASKKSRSTRTKSVLEKKYGITDEQISTWKNRFGRVKSIPIQDNWYVYRGMSRLEWEKLTDDESSIEVENPSDQLKKEFRVANRCLLYPEKLDPTSPAEGGVASVLFGEILKFSGFEPDIMEGIEL